MGTATTEQIWDAFHTPLQQFIRRRVPDDPTAEDLLQEVFLKIHQHIGGLKDARQLESWLYTLTRNIIIDYYRSQRRTTDPGRRHRIWHCRSIFPTTTS